MGVKVPVDPESFRAWVRSLPDEQQVEAVRYFSSAASRQVAAQEFNRIVEQLVRRSTYQRVADQFGWSVANVKRRVTDYRRAQGTLRPPRHRKEQPAIPEATFRPPG